MTSPNMAGFVEREVPAMSAAERFGDALGDEASALMDEALQEVRREAINRTREEVRAGVR